METIDFINIIQPEHDRTSCSDDNIDNGFCIEEDGSVHKEWLPRCRRCAYLEVLNGSVNPNDEGVRKYFREW